MCLNNFNLNITTLEGILEPHELENCLFQFRLEATLTFNSLHEYNKIVLESKDLSLYVESNMKNLSSYMESKENEVKKKQGSLSSELCKKILREGFYLFNKERSNAKSKEQFMNLFQSFLNEYEKKAKGLKKLDCLVSFMETNGSSLFDSNANASIKKAESHNIRLEKDIEQIRHETDKAEAENNRLQLQILNEKERINDARNKINILEKDIEILHYQIKEIDDRKKISMPFQKL